MSAIEKLITEYSMFTPIPNDERADAELRAMLNLEKDARAELAALRAKVAELEDTALVAIWLIHGDQSRWAAYDCLAADVDGQPLAYTLVEQSFAHGGQRERTYRLLLYGDRAERVVITPEVRKALRKDVDGGA